MASLNTILPNSIETEIHPVPLRYLELTPTRRVAYRKYEGYREPTILYIPGFFAPMDLRKTVAIEEYAIQNGYSNVRYDQECVGKSTGSQTTIGKKVSKKSDKEVNLVTCTNRTADMHIAEVPIWAKYSCIDFLDPKSGILELFGFLLPNFSTKMVFFYAFWRAAVKNQNKTIQSIYSPSWILFSRLRHPVIGTSYMGILGIGIYYYTTSIVRIWIVRNIYIYKYYWDYNYWGTFFYPSYPDN